MNQPNPIADAADTVADATKRTLRNPFPKTKPVIDGEDPKVKSLKDKTKTVLAFVGAGAVLGTGVALVASKRTNGKPVTVTVTPPSVDATTTES